MIALLPVLGIIAGALTTMAGLGGGILLLLAISLLWGPAAGLASTSLALLVSNAHRYVLFRKDLNRPVALSFALGAVPGSLVGGFLAARVPEAVLAWTMVGMTALAFARALKWWTWSPKPRWITPIGFGIGILTGTSGGAGVLVAPLLLSAGLTGAPYIATAALASVAMHAGRVTAYAAEGMFTRDTLIRSAILTVSLMVGNLLGKGLRKRLLDEKRASVLELGTLVVCVTLAVVGVGK